MRYHNPGIHTGFFYRGGGNTSIVLSQLLLCVVEMHLFFIKCINEKTKQLSSERMMLYITKSRQHVKILGGGDFPGSSPCMNP